MQPQHAPIWLYSIPVLPSTSAGNVRWVCLRWLSGDRVEGPLHRYGRYPIDGVSNFIDMADEFDIPGIPRAQNENYELIWERTLELNPCGFVINPSIFAGAGSFVDEGMRGPTPASPRGAPIVSGPVYIDRVLVGHADS